MSSLHVPGEKVSSGRGRMLLEGIVYRPGKHSATGHLSAATQKGHPYGWPSALFDAWQLRRASCPPPSGPLLRNVQIRSRRICPSSGERLPTDTRQKKKPCTFVQGLFFCLMPGSSLLSHGETPHYHRRYGVSLLSSAWGQVGPPR